MKKETICKWVGHKEDPKLYEEQYYVKCKRCGDENYEWWEIGYLYRPFWWFKWRVWYKIKTRFLSSFFKEDLPF